jgi:hypothetical protein
MTVAVFRFNFAALIEHRYRKMRSAVYVIPSEVEESLIVISPAYKTVRDVSTSLDMTSGGFQQCQSRPRLVRDPGFLSDSGAFALPE